MLEGGRGRRQVQEGSEWHLTDLVEREGGRQRRGPTDCLESAGGDRLWCAGARARERVCERVCEVGARVCVRERAPQGEGRGLDGDECSGMRIIADATAA
eukprot:6190570-Pleurochrysis_carterae.AAC.1